MKLSVVAIFALVSSSAQAFVTQSKTSQAFGVKYASKLNVYKAKGAAKSPVEDLELTRKVILGHIDSIDDTVIVEKKSEKKTAGNESDVKESKRGIRKKVMKAVKKITPFKK